MIELHNISEYAGNNFLERKFREGFRIYSTKNPNHIFECGLVNRNQNNLKVKTLCLKTAHLKDGFYEVDREIQSVDGKILKFECRCPAGMSGQCKHVLGVLFYCM